MRTNIEIDDHLLEEGFRFTGAKTKKELIHLALQELIEHRQRLNLLELEGKIKFHEGYDYKSMREGK
jgi:Arc/MetJ family transcription regulator